MCGSGYTLKKNKGTQVGFILFFLEYSDLLGNVLNKSQSSH